MSGPHSVLADLLALEEAYRAWLDLLDEEAAGRVPDAATVAGTLVWVRSAVEAVGQPTADVCWRRVSSAHARARGEGT
jgi:hypothetical protein